MRCQDQKIAAFDKQRQALELRKRGMSYADIAGQVGYRSASGAHQAVQRALQKTIHEAAADLREIEVERLDALQDAVWDRAMEGDKDAVDRVLRVMERRAKLLGLDSPMATDITSGGQTLVIMDR